jgi:predicted nucleic acid-binding Zn ribbon protein
MPNCTNCGTWNPDDKNICWRCQTVLPKPVEKKVRTQRRFAGLPLYLWIVMIFFFIMLFASRCFVTEISRLAG